MSQLERPRRGFRRLEPERRWPSVIVSVGVTGLLFALAFGSMVSLPRLANRSRPTSDQVAVVRLPTAVERPPDVVVRRQPAKKPVIETETPPVQKTLEAPAPIIVQPQAAPPVAAPTIPIGVPTSIRDIGSTDTSRNERGRGSSVPSRSGKGASIEPAGISLSSRAPNTPFVRDSILKSQMALIPSLAATRAPTGREKAELEQSQRNALALRQRTLTSGNSRDLVVLQGKGMNGVGAADPSPAGGLGFGVSIPFTLFSSGPTREQRRRDSIIDADNQLRQRRLQDRLLLKRDSILADSLRADSLRRRIVPVP